MHTTALENAKRFKESYLLKATDKIAEIGSRVVLENKQYLTKSNLLNKEECMRDIFHDTKEYIGLDFESGRGVDIIIKDPYSFPLNDNSMDIVICSSCFEHSEFFWLTFLEMCRICKDQGLIYLNVPSNGRFHRYPVDCWRFYPDSGIALQNWAKRNNINITQLESYTSNQEGTIWWNDFVAIFGKGDKVWDSFPNRIIDKFSFYTNGICFEDNKFRQYNVLTEDHARRAHAYKLSMKMLRAYDEDKIINNYSNQTKTIAGVSSGLKKISWPMT